MGRVIAMVFGGASNRSPSPSQLHNDKVLYNGSRQKHSKKLKNYFLSLLYDNKAYLTPNNYMVWIAIGNMTLSKKYSYCNRQK